MVMSVGGLLEHEEWFAEAERQGCRIYVPSGAIAGLDGLRAAAAGRLSMVILTSRKPIAALRGAKYVTERRIDLDSLKTETVLFEGPPEEACRAFPATSNVAASLRLAGGQIGGDSRSRRRRAGRNGECSRNPGRRRFRPLPDRIGKCALALEPAHFPPGRAFGGSHSRGDPAHAASARLAPNLRRWRAVDGLNRVHFHLRRDASSQDASGRISKAVRHSGRPHCGRPDSAHAIGRPTPRGSQASH